MDTYDIPLTIICDLGKNTAAPQVISINQNEANVKKLRVEFVSGGKPWEIPSGFSCNILMKKADGFAVDNPAESISGNKAVFNVTSQMTAAVGENHFQIQVVKGENDTRGFSCVLNVQSSVLDGNEPVSEDDKQTIWEIVDDAISNALKAFEVDETLTKQGKAADAKATGDTIKTSFEGIGGADKYVKNVKIICKKYTPILISYFRNNYEGVTGLRIFKTNEDGTDYSVILKDVIGLSGSYHGVIDNEFYISFDYDLTQVPEGSAISSTGLKYKVKNNCYLYSDFVSFLGGYRKLEEEDEGFDFDDLETGSIYTFGTNYNFKSCPEDFESGTILTINYSNISAGGTIQLLFDGFRKKIAKRSRFYDYGSSYSEWAIFESADYAKSSFEDIGGADKYVKNVKVLTNENFPILITYIRNNNNGTGLWVYKTNEDGTDYSDVIKRVDVTSLKGHYEGDITDHIKISFDYDISTVESGTAITGTGKAYLLKNSCYYPYIPAIKMCTIAMFQKFAVIGDSFASGEIIANGVRGDYYDLSWGQVLARMNGNACINLSVGGLTTRTWLTNEKGLQLLKSSEPQQLYICALGINDVNFLGPDYLGTIGDIKDDYQNNSDTFYGNYGRIISEIKTKASKSKIILSTTQKNTGSFLLFNNAIMEIAQHFGLPYIVQNDDLFFNSDFYLNHMVSAHPVGIVYSGMALAFDRLIEKCMRENIDYFSDYIGQ